ncbi:MAG TPA: hypothetical protein VM901_06370 [Bdellovibrionota bacterium]|nr:hypothetical protein [Bdellovibrionota bacterium]
MMSVKQVSALAVLALGACSTGPKVKPEALAKVKTVGIVGFEIVQQQPKDLEISIGGSSSSDAIDSMPMSKIPVATKHGSEVVEVLRKQLQQDLGWKVATQDALRKDATYKAITKEQTSGWRSLPPVGAQYEVFASEGIMDYWAWEKLGADKRQELMKALGLDAALVIRARTELKESFTLKKLYGGGNYHPKVDFELKLYAADGKDVIWSDYRVAGVPTSEKAGHFAGISKREALDKLVVVGAEQTAHNLKVSHDGGPKK